MVDFMKSANNAYQKDEIRLMEQEILIVKKIFFNKINYSSICRS